MILLLTIQLINRTEQNQFNSNKVGAKKDDLSVYLIIFNYFKIFLHFLIILNQLNDVNGLKLTPQQLSMLLKKYQYNPKLKGLMNLLKHGAKKNIEN